MSLFFLKIWERIKEYWQVVVGLAVGLGFALKLWWRLRAQKKVMKNEVQSAKKKAEAEKDYSNQVENVATVATKEHDARVKAIDLEEKEQTLGVQEDFNDQLKSNREATNNQLANKLGSSLGVDVILPEDENE